ncbi:MAG: hypothetical protein WC455_10440 [Dehalococcoidia bacterium]
MVDSRPINCRRDGYRLSRIGSAERLEQIMESIRGGMPLCEASVLYGVSSQLLSYYVKRRGIAVVRKTKMKERGMMACGKCGKEFEYVIGGCRKDPIYCGWDCFKADRRKDDLACYICHERKERMLKGGFKSGKQAYVCYECARERGVSAWERLKADPERYGERKRKQREYMRTYKGRRR